jgi:outer membrane protein TolC
MKKRLVLPLFLFAFLAKAQESSTGIQAKQNYSFSLEQAISHALTHNYSVINASRDIASAQQKKWETTAAGLPQISGSVGYLNNIDFTLSGVSSNAFNPDGDPNGISLFAFGTKHNMNGQLSLSQLLFDGSYIVALQASKTYLKFYENAQKKTNSEIREMVINAYGNVLLSQESILIFEKNKANLEKTLSDTKETFRNGLIEEENVEQLQITLATVNSNLNNLKRVLGIANNMLKITLGIDIDRELILTDKLDNLTIANVDLAFSQKDFNVSDNIDYQMGANFEKQRQLEYKLERYKALPTLAAAYNLGYNSFANEFSFFNTNQKWNNFSNIGVNLSVPVFSSLGRYAKTQQAKIALEQAQTKLSETKQKLKLQYSNAKSEYEFSLEEFATSKNNLKLAERIEKKQQIKFTEGLSTSFDFSEAQRQLYSAQQSYLQSMVNIINKKTALEKVINKN